MLLAPERFRRELRHDCHRYEALRRKAAERGLRVASRPGLADPQHLTSRIGSLIMDLQNHPDPGESALSLWRCAGLARAAKRPSPWRAAPCSLCGFSRSAFFPRPWATKLISWRLDPVPHPSDSDVRWQQSGAGPFSSRPALPETANARCASDYSRDSIPVRRVRAPKIWEWMAPAKSGRGHPPKWLRTVSLFFPTTPKSPSSRQPFRPRFQRALTFASNLIRVTLDWISG